MEELSESKINSRPVRPFLRRFSSHGAQSDVERCRKAQNLQNPLLERTQSRPMSRGRLGPFDDGERAVLKRFEQTLGGGAVGCALRLAGLQPGPFGPVRRPRTAPDPFPQRQHP